MSRLVKSVFSVLSVLFSATLCLSQSNDLPKREAFNLEIPVSDSTYYEAAIDASSYVLPDNTIQLYPGETIYVEVELKKKKIVSMKTVKENLHPEKTLEISFSQQTEGNTHQGMMLSVHNPFDMTLEYKATIFLMAYNKWAPTTIMPVYPKISSYELWQDILVTIALSDWTFK
jgi:hypothetical protein